MNDLLQRDESGQQDNSLSDHADDSNVPSSYSDKAAEEKTRDISPEALVRRENRAIRLLKTFAILVLLAAALSAAGLIFQYTKGSEQATFESDFDLISEAITQSLLRDAESYIKSAQSIATALTILIEAYNTTQLDFSVPLPRYKSLTSEVVTTSYYATWSPLIRSDEERLQFEAMVKSKEEEGFFAEMTHPPCFVCGDIGLAPSTPDAVVVFPGSGQYQCDDVDFAGRNGVIEENSCAYVTNLVVDQCACKSSSSMNERIEERSPSAGIFRMANNKNRTIEEEPWNGGPYLPMFLDAVLVSDRQPVLYNHLSYPKLAHAAAQMIFTGVPQLTEMTDLHEPTFYATYSSVLQDSDSGPASILYFPVVSPQGNETAGALSLQLNWGNFLTTPVPKNGKLANIVIESSCGQVHTYKVKNGGVQMNWIGEGDYHERKYDRMVRKTSFGDFSFFRLASVGRDTNTTQEDSCDYRFSGKYRQIKICQINQTLIFLTPNNIIPIPKTDP
jgi:hypothetical protein